MTNSSLIKNLCFLSLLMMILLALVAYRKLLETTALNGIIHQLHYIDQAVNVFTEKYGGLPGDLGHTESLGLSESSTDGNQDNRITGFQYYQAKIADQQVLNLTAEGEPLYFWQHLINAELLSHNYDVFPQVTHQPMRLLVFSTDYGNYYQLGIDQINNHGQLIMNNAALSPITAQRLDLKIDDGIAFSGKVQAVGGSSLTINNFMNLNPACVTKLNYNVNNPRKSCQLRIRTGF